MKFKKIIYFIFFYNVTFSSEPYFYRFVFYNKEDKFNDLNGILYKRLGLKKFNINKIENNKFIYFDKNFKLEEKNIFKIIVNFVSNLC